MSAVPMVLHVTETLVGGVATYLDVLLRDQVERYGAQNVWLLCPKAHLQYLAADIAAVITVRGYTAGRGPNGVLALVNALRQADRAHRPNIVHLHSTFAGAAGRASLSAAGKRVIYNPHGWSFSMTTLSAPVKQACARFEMIMARRCAVVIAVSESERLEAGAAGLDDQRIAVVRSGLPPLEKKLQRGERSERIQLLFIGRHCPQKGLDWLLDLMRENPDLPVDLTVFGAESSALLRVPANVRLVGWKSADEIAEALADADALIMPSRWEAFGFSALEAMRAGVAVLASDRGALPELVVDGETGAVFPLEQPQVLAELLRSTSRDTYRRWGRAGAFRQRDHFNATAMCDGVNTLYRKVANAV